MSSHKAHCIAARSAILAGGVADAGEHQRAAMALAATPEERAEALVLRARLAVLQGEVAAVVAELLAWADELEPTAPGLAGEVLLELVVLELYGEHDIVAEHVERAHRLLVRDGSATTRARADVILGLVRVFAGQAVAADAILGRSLDLIRLGGAPDEVAHLLQVVVVGLAGRELYPDAARLCRRSIRAARSVGAVGLLPVMLCYLANTVYFTAEFVEQEMAAAEALELATASGQVQMAAYARVCRGVAMAMRGEAAHARDELEAALLDLDASGGVTFRNLTLNGLAMIDLGAGDWERAVSSYGRLRANWAQDPVSPGILHWRADEIEALWRSGDRTAARSRLVELAADLPDFSHWETAAVARLEGFIGPEDAADSRFAAAMESHRRGGSRFEEARTRMMWGEWLLDHDRSADALPHLQAAETAFADLDTRAWAARARALIERAGPGPAAAHGTPAGTSLPGPARVLAFGPLTVHRPGDPVGVRVALDTPGNLLRLLVIEGGSVRVENAVGRLWPDATGEQGSARLRTVLARARRRYGQVIIRDGGVLRWDDDVSVDVRAFDELARTARHASETDRAIAAARAAVRLYRDDLLVLEQDHDAVAVAREQLRHRYLGLLDMLAQHEEERGRLDAATDLLRAAIARDRYDESRYLRLASLLSAQDRPAAAHQVIEQGRAAAAEIGLPGSSRLHRWTEHG